MRHISPHARCVALDIAGEAYWIRVYSWALGAVEQGTPVLVDARGDLNVLSHGPDWVEVAAKPNNDRSGNSVAIWTRWDNLGSFQICEEGD